MGGGESALGVREPWCGEHLCHYQAWSPCIYPYVDQTPSTLLGQKHHRSGSLCLPRPTIKVQMGRLRPAWAGIGFQEPTVLAGVGMAAGAWSADLAGWGLFPNVLCTTAV